MALVRGRYDFISFAEKVLAYTEGFDQQRFETSGLNYDATIRNLVLIGEAATRIPLPMRESMPNIQWRQIVAMRNRLIHGYLGIDNDTLWSVIQDDVPSLLEELLVLKKQPMKIKLGICRRDRFADVGKPIIERKNQNK